MDQRRQRAARPLDRAPHIVGQRRGRISRRHHVAVLELLKGPGKGLALLLITNL